MWQAGVEAARDRSIRVLAASPAAAETGLSFAAIGDMLGEVADDVLPELPAPQRRALEVALLLTEAEHSTPDPRAVAVGLLSALRVLEPVEQVLVAVDDVQWLDTASAGVLSYAARRLHDEPIGLLLARRAGEGEPAPLDLDQALAEHALLRVGPLTLGATHRLLRERLGLTLPRPILRRIHETSGGNPFYTLELAHAVEGRDISAGAPLALSPTLDDLLRNRIVVLPAETREALFVAACASDPRIAVLSQVLGVDARAPFAQPPRHT